MRTKWGLRPAAFVWCIVEKEGKLRSEEKMGTEKSASHGLYSITRSANVRLMIRLCWDCKNIPLETAVERRCNTKVQ